MSSTIARVTLLGILAAGLTLPAGAQMDPVVMGQGLVMSSAIYAQAKRDAARLRSKQGLPVVSAASAGTRFTPSLARRKAQAAKFLAAASRINPEIGKNLAPAFRGDPVRYVTPFLAKVGVRTDDVADLAAAYLVSAWYGAHGKTGTPPRTDLTAVRDQLRRVYAGSAKLRGASNATKQDVGEGLLYLAMLNDVFVETMRAHPESKPRLTAEIAAGAKSTFGLDLRAMRITRAGLTR